MMDQLSCKFTKARKWKRGKMYFDYWCETHKNDGGQKQCDKVI